MSLYAVVLLIGMQQAPRTELQYVAPLSATRKDLELTAIAIQSRCKEFGYDGVLATPKFTETERSIILSYKAGFTSRMQPHVDKLACSGYSLELRFRPEFTERELDKYEPGHTAPDGAEWIQDARGEKYTRHLLWKEPKAIVTGFLKAFSKSQPDVAVDESLEVETRPALREHYGWSFHTTREHYFEFDKPMTKWLGKMKPEVLSTAVLFFDGKILNTPGILVMTKPQFGARFRWYCLDADPKKNESLHVRINTPLPLKLEPKDD